MCIRCDLIIIQHLYSTLKSEDADGLRRDNVRGCSVCPEQKIANMVASVLSGTPNIMYDIRISTE